MISELGRGREKEKKKGEPSSIEREAQHLRYGGVLSCSRGRGEEEKRASIARKSQGREKGAVHRLSTEKKEGWIALNLRKGQKRREKEKKVRQRGDALLKERSYDPAQARKKGMRFRVRRR